MSPIKTIDDFLNRTTMYRLVVLVLLGLLIVAFAYSVVGILPYEPWAIIASPLFLYILGWATNTLFAWFYRAPTNHESFTISALILSLLITPPGSLMDFKFLGWAVVLTMASKFILALNKKHLFNPVAIAVVITALVLNQSASWWVGTAAMLPFVLVTAFLIVRKIRRFTLVLSFILTATVMIALGSGNLKQLFLDSPLIFFAGVMLTEPLTTPPTRILQILYGVLIGIIFYPKVHLGSIYSTPELALIAGNLFAYLVSPKVKLVLKIKNILPLGTDQYDFIFKAAGKFAYLPGQYMEWTLPHDRIDTRGNRRYFTLASSPTEPELRLGVKFYEPASSFKSKLLAMKPGDPIVASQLAGDFTLPRDALQKLVFIAGGIGITPFRSMIKYLLDREERRDITLFYTNKTAAEICYADLFKEAIEKIGLQVVYINTSISGRLTADQLTQTLPDFLDRHYYLSGPHTLVAGFEAILKGIQVPALQITTDYFPGFV